MGNTMAGGLGSGSFGRCVCACVCCWYAFGATTAAAMCTGSRGMETGSIVGGAAADAAVAEETFVDEGDRNTAGAAPACGAAVPSRVTSLPPLMSDEGSKNENGRRIASSVAMLARSSAEFELCVVADKSCAGGCCIKTGSEAELR